jgi:alpha-L-rhamnosidase
MERIYPNMVAWMDQMAGNMSGDIIARDSYADWCSPPDNLHTPYGAFHSVHTSGPLIATAYFYSCAKLMSRYATLLEKPDDAAKFSALAARLQKGLNDTFFKKEQGRYDNGSATSAVLPLAFGMVPPDQQQRVVDQLAGTITVQNHNHISTGLIGCQWINSALAEYGRADLAYLMATQTTYPSLGYMVENHATTIWELWDGNTAGNAMNSGNHMMLVGDLCKFLYEDLAGIRPDPQQPGFKHVIMHPDPVGDLKSASGTHRSAYGVVSSAWTRTGGSFRWDITIPPNTTATLFLPAKSASAVTESGKPAAQADGLKFVSMHENRAEFTAGSGVYHLLSN